MTEVDKTTGRGARFVTALAMIAIALPAYASGGGGGSSGGGGGSSGGGGNGGSGSAGTSTRVTTCKKTGEVYDSARKKCVMKSSQNFPDKDLYEQGRALALEGEYASALDLLQSVRNTKDPMVLTMIGYSKRKMGDVDGGFASYRQALAIDPDNVNTHEYMGEAYVLLGRMEEAKVELATLQRLCGGSGCEQYDDLAKALAGTPDED